jgi:AcrR family transcriptional regulator
MMRRENAIVSRDPIVVLERILDAAQKEFMSVGFERATTNRIVTQLGGSKATLFRYFPTKAALFDGVIRRIAGAWNEQVNWAGIASDIPEEWLTAFGCLTLKWVLREENLFVGRTVISEGNLFPGVRRVFMELASLPLQQIVVGKLRRWTSEGLLRSVNPKRDATSYLDLVLSGPVSRQLYGIDMLKSPGQIQSHVAQSIKVFLKGVQAWR